MDRLRLPLLLVYLTSRDIHAMSITILAPNYIVNTRDKIHPPIDRHAWSTQTGTSSKLATKGTNVADMHFTGRINDL